MSSTPPARPGVVHRHDPSGFELVCPAGSLPALKSAVDEGADCVYLGFRDATNARNFAGLNFDAAAIQSGVACAHARGRKVLRALNAAPQASNPAPWRSRIAVGASSPGQKWRSSVTSGARTGRRAASAASSRPLCRSWAASASPSAGTRLRAGASRSLPFALSQSSIVSSAGKAGRSMVGNAGVIKSEVVLISKKADNDNVRWVFLDIGKFGGLAETMDEAIRYPIVTAHDGGETAPCVLAGPTCDSADVMYEKTPYPLPLSLTIGDEVLIEGTGAYTTTYSAVAFNGFEPLRSYVI